jgi:hypothetical protein
MLTLIFLLYLCHATWFSVKNQTTSLTKWTQTTKQTRVNWICGIIASLFLKHTITIKKLCHCHCNLADVWNTPLCTLEDILGPLLGILKLLYFRMDTFTPASLLRPTLWRTRSTCHPSPIWFLPRSSFHIAPPLCLPPCTPLSALCTLGERGSRMSHRAQFGWPMSGPWVQVRVFSATLLVEQGWSPLISLCLPAITPSGWPFYMKRGRKCKQGAMCKPLSTTITPSGWPFYTKRGR